MVPLSCQYQVRALGGIHRLPGDPPPPAGTLEPPFKPPGMTLNSAAARLSRRHVPCRPRAICDAPRLIRPLAPAGTLNVTRKLPCLVALKEAARRRPKSTIPRT